MTALAPHLAVQLIVDEPTVVGSLAVFPLIADRSPSLEYVSFAEACTRGATVRELEGGASVNDLIVRNPLAVPVLLYEGEEVLGAQQNRTFDASMLVAANSELRVPVSCVEAGRWDATRSTESFAPAPQTANPWLRQMKNAQARNNLSAGSEARADQSAVWREVADAGLRHGSTSDTGAMHDVFESRRVQLDAVAQAVPMFCSQVGMLAAIGGRFVVLDHVSDVEAFATLHDRLLQGYALDALEVAPGTTPSCEDASDFIRLLLDVPYTLGPTAGLGAGARFDFGGLAGTGLIHDDEAVAVTAFADRTGDDGAAARAGRVRRPSRRRPR